MWSILTKTTVLNGGPCQDSGKGEERSCMCLEYVWNVCGMCVGWSRAARTPHKGTPMKCGYSVLTGTCVKGVPST